MLTEQNEVENNVTQGPCSQFSNTLLPSKLTRNILELNHNSNQH